MNNYKEFEEMLDCQMTNRGDYDKRQTVQKTADEGITGVADGHNGETNSTNMNKNNERIGHGHSAVYGTGTT